MTNLRLRYQTLEFGKLDIHLCTLRDKQQFHDPAGVAEGLGISSATYIKDHNLLHRLFEVIQKDWGIELPNGNPVAKVSTRNTQALPAEIEGWLVMKKSYCLEP